MTANYEEHGFEVRAKKLPEACTSCPFWLVNPETLEEGECYITGHIIALDGPQDEGRMNDCPIGDNKQMENENRINLQKGIQALIQEVSEDICDNYCKYRETADENNLCDITRDGSPCPLDRLQ